MKSRLLGATIAAAAAVLAATAAGAATYTVTFKGVVKEGEDFGIFGVNGNLAGYSWAAVYTIDPSQASGAFYNPEEFYSDVRSQGADVPVTATFTLNGVNYEFG